MQVRQGFLEKALSGIERSAQCSRKPLYSPSVRLSRRRYSKLTTKGEATVLLLSAKKNREKIKYSGQESCRESQSLGEFGRVLGEFKRVLESLGEF